MSLTGTSPARQATRICRTGSSRRITSSFTQSPTSCSSGPVAMWYLRHETGFGKAFAPPDGMFAEALPDGADSNNDPPQYHVRMRKTKNLRLHYFYKRQAYAILLLIVGHDCWKL